MITEPFDVAGSIVIESVRIKAGAQSLEGELSYPEFDQPRGLVVVAGPHPLLGGSMRNNVVRALSEGLAERGLITVRFNYACRASGAAHDQELAEFWHTSQLATDMFRSADLAAAVAFARSLEPDLPMLLAGYSFGCVLLPTVQRQARPAAVVAVAPTLAKHDYRTYENFRSPVLVVESEGDFVSNPARSHELMEWLCPRSRLIREKRDNHFFRGHEPWLVDTILAFLQESGVFAHDHRNFSSL